MNLSYRDEVPPVPQKSKIKLFALTPKTLMWAGIGLGVIIVGVVLLILTSSNSIAPQLQRLSARLDTMKTILEESHESIQNSDLRNLNSDLRILTTGSIVKLQEPLQAAGMGSVSGSIRTAEADAATVQEIERAKTGGNFDVTYSRILEQKVDTIVVLLSEIYDDTRNTTLRTALSETYNDFVSIRERLNNLEL